MVASGLLRKHGAVVDVASGGLEGVEMALAAQPPYDAILMDLQMPDIDGFEATRRILTQTVGQAAPIIAVTANAMASDRAACLDAGMVDHLSKPIDVQQMIATILRYTRGYIASRAALASVAEPDATPSNPHGDPQLLDVENAVIRMGGDAELYAQVARSFQSEVPDQWRALQQSLQEQEWQDASRYAHTLKGLSGTVGALVLADASTLLEKALGADEKVQAALLACAEKVQVALTSTLAALDEQLSPAPDDDRLSAAAPADTPVRSQRDAVQALSRLIALLKESNMRSTTESALLRKQYSEVFGMPLHEIDEATQQLRFAEALVKAENLLGSFS